jgi:hypothetical protein
LPYTTGSSTKVVAKTKIYLWRWEGKGAMVGAVGDLMVIEGKGAAKMPKAKFNGHSCMRSAGRRRSIVVPAPTSIGGCESAREKAVRMREESGTRLAARGGGKSRSFRRVAEVFPHGRFGGSFRGHDTGSLKQQTARGGVRALPSNVSRLISRGLQKFYKNMRNTLNMNNLQNTTQMLDFLMVRKKKGVFGIISHPQPP